MTSYAVLGLLNRGEITGYDLLKHAKQSMSYIWEPTKSHVYRELKRLVSIGLATERDVAQEHRPDKRIFKITPEGVAQFRSWLENSEPEAESVRSPFLLQLFFGGQTERGLLMRRIEKYREQSRAELQQLDRLGEQLKGDTEHLLAFLSLRAAILRKSASIAWTDETLEQLRRHS